MAGPGEFELQLGHLCNDRCVFCKSGRLTEEGNAPLVPFEVLAAQVREAYAAGHRRITFLGGEPTIQPAFLDVVKLAVSLGFESIVIFSNGSKTGRSDLIDKVLATGGHFEWRFSVHGATREAHERTTGRKGGFDQVLRSLSKVRERGQRATVNMCLVQQNAGSVENLPELLAPAGVSQLHVDVLNPADTGFVGGMFRRSGRKALAKIMPRHSEVAPSLERMARSFPEDFDVGIGGLPFCVAPALAPWIHHDHVPMWTASAKDGAPSLKAARFLARANDKVKPDGCKRCVFDDRCTGVFEEYAKLFGTDELQPVSAESLKQLDTYPRLVALRLRDLLRAALSDLAPWVSRVTVEETSLRESFITLHAADGAELVLLFFDGRRNANARSDWCSLRVERSAVGAQAALGAINELWSRLEAKGMRTLHPPAADSVVPIEVSVAARLRRLRDGAPFGSLRWIETRVDRGNRVEVVLESPEAEVAVVWLCAENGHPTGGYRIEPSKVKRAPSKALVQGLEQVLEALGKGPRRASS
jgi:MoaA/NifB/PqqE/SkfB family radical SAM enzyme